MSVEIIEVGAGERHVERVGDGETLSNTIFDITADGANATIAAYGSNWTVKNVAFSGSMSGRNTAIGCAEEGGGTSVIENVYLGDGGSGGHRHGLGLWVAPKHNGHLDINRVNIQGMGDNSFYCSAPGGKGTVELRNCYSANSWVSHFRLAKGEVKNCVALNDDNGKDGRGVWAWAPGAVTVDGCDLAMNGRHYSVVAGANGSGGPVTVKNTQWDTGFHGGYNEPESQIEWANNNGNNPDGSRIPEGCPTTVDEAVSGRSTDGDEITMDHELTLGGRFEYRIEVDGEIAPTQDRARWLTEGEAYNTEEGWAEWFLTGSDSTWLFSGTITNIEISDYEGEQQVDSIAVDGEELDTEDGFGEGGFGEGGYGGGEEEESDDDDERTKDEIIADLEAELDTVRTERDELAARLDEVEEEVDESADESESLTSRLRGIFG